MLTYTEWVTILYDIESGFADEELAFLFSVLDTDGDGLLSYQEFFDWAFAELPFSWA